MKFTFFAEYKTFLFRPRVFLALSGAGYAGGPPVHHGASVGPGRAPWRVLWAIKVAKVPTGSLSAELEPTRPVETPKRFFFFNFALLLLCTSICYKYNTSPQPLYQVYF